MRIAPFLALILLAACTVVPQGPQEQILLGDRVMNATGWGSPRPGWIVEDWTYKGTNTAPDIPVESVWMDGFSWTDYTVQADVSLRDGYTPSDAQLIFRYQSPDEYGACRLLQYEGTRLEILDTKRGVMMSAPFPTNVSQWYTLRTTIQGEHVDCEVIGGPKISATYTATQNGTVGLRNTHIPVAFKNMRVTFPPQAQRS